MQGGWYNPITFAPFGNPGIDFNSDTSVRTFTDLTRLISLALLVLGYTGGQRLNIALVQFRTGPFSIS